MHPADIKAAIEKAHSSQIEIARALRVSDVAINHVIHGRSTSRKIATHIAKLTKLPLAELWPGRYDEAGTGPAPKRRAGSDRRDHERRAVA